MCVFFFFKQKTAYEMRISDWSSDVCSSDLRLLRMAQEAGIDPGIAKRQRLAIDAHRAVLQGPHQFLGGVHQREQVAAMVPAMHIGRRDEDLKRRVDRP